MKSKKQVSHMLKQKFGYNKNEKKKFKIYQKARSLP